MYDDDFNYDDFDDTNKSKLALFYETNKKLVWLLVGIIIFIIVLLIIIKINDKDNNPKQLPIDVNILSKSDIISIGNTMSVYAEVKNVKNANVLWSSTDPNIATVDSNGLVKGINYGVVKIIAKYTHTDGISYTDEYEIVVSEGNPSIKIKNVKLPDGEILMNVGNTFNLPVMIEPADGYKENVVYTSDNTGVVSIDQSGNIKALKVGTTSVKINVNNGSFTDSIVVNVINEKITSQVMITPKTISLKDSEKTLTVGDTYQLQYDIYPQNSTPLSYQWSSSNNSVATVTNGFIKALKSGKTEIVLKSKFNNVYDKLVLTVVDKKVEPQAIMISSSSLLYLKVGETSKIMASVIPDNATDQKIYYYSNNLNVATVDSNGVIKATGEGQTVITLSTNNGKNVLISVNVSKNSSSQSDISYSLNITSNTKSVNSTYESVMKDSSLAKEKVIVKVAYSGIIDKINICTNYDYQEGDKMCDPEVSANIMIDSSSETFTINRNGVTQFGYVAYDAKGNVVTKGNRFVKIQLDNNSGCYFNSANNTYVWGNYTANNFIYKSQYKTQSDCLKNNN